MTNRTYEEWKKVIPKKFRSFDGEESEPEPIGTVGELMDQLNLLPRDLPVRNGFNEEVKLVVYNVIEDMLDPHLSIEEV